MSDTHEHGPVTIITGASSGIGLATAKRLAARGHRLALAARSMDRLTAVRDSLVAAGIDEHDVLLVKTDVGDPIQASALVPRVVEHFDRLDCLFNNAGVAPLKTIPEHDDATLQRCFAVNVIGVGLAIADAFRQWTHQRSAGDEAPYTVINTSSLATSDPFPGFLAYAASKAAVEMMVRSAASEGEPLGVRAFAVAPGAVDTPLLRGIFSAEKLPPEACLSPEDVAAIVEQMAVGERDEQSGKTVYVKRGSDGGVEEWPA
ncbi:MAG: SDR family oxidoreductase [Planctomycetota bacterium]